MQEVLEKASYCGFQLVRHVTGSLRAFRLPHRPNELKAMAVLQNLHSPTATFKTLPAPNPRLHHPLTQLLASYEPRRRDHVTRSRRIQTNLEAIPPERI